MKKWQKYALGAFGALVAFLIALLVWPWQGLRVLAVFPKWKIAIVLTPFGMKHIRYDIAEILRANQRWLLQVSTVYNGDGQFATGIIRVIDKQGNYAYDVTIRQDGVPEADQYAYEATAAEVSATV